jgi:DNA-binding MarR family transcriptional regulator
MDFAKNDHEKRNFSSIKDYISGRKIQITQSLFSNGNKYQTDKYDIRFYPPYRNINTINLLNIMNEKRQEVPPLVIIYLLVYLSKMEVTAVHLHDLFADEKISQTYIDQALQELLEFGYIKVSYNVDDETLFYTATQKGRHFIHFSFTDIDAIQASIYGGLHPNRYTPYYRVYTEYNYASQVLFNMLLFWQEMAEQEELLSDLKERLEITFDMITPAAKETYRKLLEKAFPEHYIYTDIEKYVPDDEKLQLVLKERHRSVMFEK